MISAIGSYFVAAGSDAIAIGSNFVVVGSYQKPLLQDQVLLLQVHNKMLHNRWRIIWLHYVEGIKVIW